MIANPYDLLGVPTDADDATIRARYLELTLQFAPESHPEQSAKIRAAYERIKDLNARANDRLFTPAGQDSLDVILDELRGQRTARRITISDLYQMAGFNGR